MNNESYAAAMRKEQAKRDGFYKCYPMVKHVEDPLHQGIWETFSFIWELAVKSTQPVETITVAKEKCPCGCTYSKQMNQPYPRACIDCGTIETAH